MSRENLKGFFGAIGKDPSLAGKVKEAGTDADALIKLAKDNGYKITAKDLEAAADEMGMVGEELSDEQLEQIAGGFGTVPSAAMMAAVAAQIAGRG
jgi:predicted ribosomally synthesized peptide with nif11-like leader